MTTLERIINDRGITVYAICKEMGLNPTSTASQMAKRIKGERSMRKETFTKMVKAIERVSNDPIVMAQIEVEPNTMFIR